MIYLEDTFNLHPASPETLDMFIKFAKKYLVPICDDVGARLIAAWSSYSEWFGQVTQIMEFDDIDSLKSFRLNTSQNSDWGEYIVGLEDFAPVRRSRLLEPIESVPPKVLHEAITKSQEKRLKVYGLAILQVAANKMDEMKKGLELSHKSLPIIASWRPVVGCPTEIIDLWAMPLLPERYKRASPFEKQFFKPLREMAPMERIVQIYMLPYSPLR